MAQFEKVLAVLSAQLGSAVCRVEILSALHSWIKYGEANAALASPSLLETSFAFVHMALSADTDELLDEACELVCELFFKVHQLEQIESPEWLTVLFAGLQSVYQSFITVLGEADDEEKARKLAMLYSEAGEAFMPHFMTDHGQMQSLLELMLRTVEFPNLEVVQTTFAYWELLSSRVADETETVQETYRPVFSRLFRSLTRLHLMYPVNANAADIDKFRDFRHIVGDCLKDCVRAMGSTEALMVILELLTTSAGLTDWRPTEAILFALRTISSAVDRRESEALPQIIPAILSLPSPHSKIVYAVILNVGCYADWLRYHPEMLPPVLDYVAAGFNAGSPDCSAAAAVALKYLAESCGRLLVKFLPQLEGLYASMKTTGLTKRDRLELSEALGNVLGNIAADELAPHLSACLQPWISQLQGVDGLEALEHIELFMAVLRDEVHSAQDPVLQFWLQNGWALVETLPISPSDEYCEALSRLLRTMVAVYCPWMPGYEVPFLTLIGRFVAGKRLLLLSALRTFVIHYRSDFASVMPYIHQILLQAHSLLKADTTGAEDYFAAATATIDYCPIDAELTLSFLDLANTVLGARPPSPADVTAALVFLTHLLQRCLADTTSCLLQIISQPISICLRNILDACLTSYPPDLLADIPPILVRLDRLIPGLPTSQMQALLAALPSSEFVDRERSTLLSQFQGALSNVRANRELKEFLRQLSQSCKRRITPLDPTDD